MGAAATKLEYKRSPAPSNRALTAALAVLVLACLAPAGETMLGIAQLAVVAVIVIAGLDLAIAWSWGPHFAVEPADSGERTARLLRFTAGQSRSLRLRLTQIGRHSLLQPADLTLAWMFSDARLDRHLTLPDTPVQWTLPAGPAAEWDSTLTARARGESRGLRVGIATPSPLRLWRVRQWQELDVAARVYPDTSEGRRELMRSPVYRALLAAAQMPTTGKGREFERLREYQAGDLYSDISWKATARRNFPVTRLFQWEREQEIVFVVDHSRYSFDALGSVRSAHLDRAVETVLAGAQAALAAGDRIGLITFADRVTGWIPPQIGPAQYASLRDLLARVEPQRCQPDYDLLFTQIKTRLRRRAYLLVLANLTEPSLAEPFGDAARLVSGVHFVVAQSLLPEDIAPMYQGPPAHTLEDVYGALAGDLEWQRLREMRRRLAQQGIQFQAVPAERYLRTAVQGYLETKRGQLL